MKIIIILSAVLLSACNQNPKSDTVLKEQKLEPYLKQIFVNRHPNYETNEMIRGRAVKDLTRLVDSVAPLNYLDDFPFKILRVGSNPYGKGALVQFYVDYPSTPISLSDKVKFDVIALMNENIAATLNDNLSYTIKGKKWHRLSNEEASVLVAQTYFGPEIEIRSITDYDFNIGNYLCEVDSVKAEDINRK